MTSAIVLSDVDSQGVASVVLNDPERHNIISVEMQVALSATLERLNSDDDVRVVVVRGAGEKAFSAGGEVAQLPDRESSALARQEFESAIDHLWSTLDDFTKPVISQIDGYCLGGGLMVALKTDIRICSANSVFSVPATRLGLGPSMESVDSIVQQVGRSWAAEILFTARRLDAAEALQAGLVTRVVHRRELPSEVRGLAGAIAANAPLAVRACKVALRETARPESQRNQRLMSELVEACLRSEDHTEGKRAFAEKRDPKFTSR